MDKLKLDIDIEKDSNLEYQGRKMKDSGIEWIGEIPEDWEVLPLGKYFSERNEKVSDYDFEPLSVTKQGIVKQLEGTAKTTNHDNRKKVCIGDFVINSRSDRKQSCGVSPYNGSVSVINIILKNKTLNTNYIKYLLDNYGFAEEFYRWGSGIVADLWSTRFDKMKRIFLAIPPKSEQEKIANFLDQKTSQIDHIIDQAELSIEEYKSYKQSLITETVTKGLDPNIQMKDSGIEWIGQIPEHWDITRPNKVCKVIRGNTAFQKDDMSNKGEYVAVQYGQVYKVNEINEKYKFFINKSFYKNDQIVEKGDTILISTSETMEDLGHSSYYNREDHGLLGGEQMCLKPNKLIILNKFLYYASTYFRYELNQYATGLKVYRFRLDDLKNINIIIPSLEEQDQIVKVLDRKLPLIDKIISSKEMLITELEAYKKSLIYEAVTGKIEV